MGGDVLRLEGERPGMKRAAFMVKTLAPRYSPPCSNRILGCLSSRLQAHIATTLNIIKASSNEPNDRL